MASDILIELGVDYSKLKQVPAKAQAMLKGAKLKPTVPSRQDLAVLKAQERQIQRTGTALKQTSKQIGNVDTRAKKNIFTMAKFAIGWSLAYGAIRTAQNVVKAFIGTLLILQDEMARVATVTRSTDMASTIAQQKQAVLSYAATATAEIPEVAKVLYSLGSAGLTASEQLAGLAPIMDTIIGLNAEVESSAKLVAGIYNVFGDRLRDVTTASEKFKYISDLLSYTYTRQQIELNEIEAAMRLVASAASLVDIPLNVLVGTIGSLNSGMLKGSRSGCYDEETEVLTREGFKFWEDVTKDDEFATLDSKTNGLQYQKATRLIKEDYQGLMYRAKNKHLDLLVSPDHWMWIKNGDKRTKINPYRRKQARDIFGKHIIYKRGAKWHGCSPKYFILPSVIAKIPYKEDYQKLKEIKIPIEIFTEFLAFYLSEGYVNKGKTKNTFSYTVAICQNKTSKYYKNIKNCLDKMPFEYRYYDKGISEFRFNNKQLYDYLKQFGKSHDKYIPQIIKDLSPRLLRIFLESYNMGDGSEDFDIATVSKQMKDDLQEISLKSGYASQAWFRKQLNNRMGTEGIWIVSISKRTEFSFSYKKNCYCAKKYGWGNNTQERWIQYHGKIYCAEIPNHILFIRRNGKTVWCGNSALMNAFIGIAARSGMLATELDVLFDPNAPLDFVDIMTQLHDRFGDQALSVINLNKLMRVFGRRGGRAVGGILTRWEEWQEAINTTKDDIDGFAEKTKEVFEDTLPRQLKNLFNIWKVGFAETMGTTVEGITKIIKKHVDELENARSAADELRLAFEFFGEETKLTFGLDLEAMPRHFNSMEKIISQYKTLISAGMGAEDVDVFKFIPKMLEAWKVLSELEVTFPIEEKQLDATEKTLTSMEMLQAIIKEMVGSGLEFSDAMEKYQTEIESIIPLELLSKGNAKEKLQALFEQVKTTKELTQAEKDAIEAEKERIKEKFKLIKEEKKDLPYRLKYLEALGVSDWDIYKAKLASFEITKAELDETEKLIRAEKLRAEGIAIQTQMRKTMIEDLFSFELNILKQIGYTDVEIARRRLQMAMTEGDLNEIYKARLSLQEALTAKVMKELSLRWDILQMSKEEKEEYKKKRKAIDRLISDLKKLNRLQGMQARGVFGFDEGRIDEAMRRITRRIKKGEFSLSEALEFIPDKLKPQLWQALGEDMPKELKSNLEKALEATQNKAVGLNTILMQGAQSFDERFLSTMDAGVIAAQKIKNILSGGPEGSVGQGATTGVGGNTTGRTDRGMGGLNLPSATGLQSINLIIKSNVPDIIVESLSKTVTILQKGENVTGELITSVSKSLESILKVGEATDINYDLIVDVRDELNQFILNYKRSKDRK